MWVHIQSETKGDRGRVHDTFTVGHYGPDGTWYPESDWFTSEEAAARVAYLNGR